MKYNLSIMDFAVTKVKEKPLIYKQIINWVLLYIQDMFILKKSMS